MKKPIFVFAVLVILFLAAPPVTRADTVKAVPLYHLAKWVPGALAHFYTADEQEKQSAIANGWSEWAVHAYVSPVQLDGTIPLYRLYYAPNYDHFYTADPYAKNSAINQGWTYEGITGYVLPTIPQPAGTLPLYQKYDNYQHIHFYDTTPEDTPNYKYQFYICRVWSSAATVADINITAPVGNSSVIAGSDQEIKWTTNTSGGYIGLYLSTDYGLSWQSITPVPVENKGSIIWKVPSTYTTHARIKAIWMNSPLYPNTTWATNITGDFYITSPSSPASNSASNLVAIPKGCTEIDLTWIDNSTDETGFSVERKTGNGAFGIVTVLGKDKTSYADTSVSANTTYTYRIRTWKGGKPSEPSNEVTVTTPSLELHFKRTPWTIVP